MIEDLNPEDFKYEKEGKSYIIHSCIKDNQLYLSAAEEYNFSKGINIYSGLFSLNDLQEKNKVFNLCSTIYEAKDRVQVAVLQKLIDLKNLGNGYELIVYFMIGAVKTPFSLLLNKEESNPQEENIIYEHKANDQKLYEPNYNLYEPKDNYGQIKEEPVIYEQIPNIKPNEEVKLYSPIKEEYRPSQRVSKPFKSAPKNPDYNSNLINGGALCTTYVIDDPDKNKTTNYNYYKMNAGISDDKMKYGENELADGIVRNIIDDSSEISLVTRKLQRKSQKKIRYKLLYTGTKDGDKAQVFHEKCDSAERTIVLIEDFDGHKFGGFTDRSWEGENKVKKDKAAFLFSLDQNKTYDVKPGEYCIGCYPNFGPVFMGCQIRVYDEFLTKGGSTFTNDQVFNTSYDFELTGGKQNFEIRELEVYEVELV